MRRLLWFLLFIVVALPVYSQDVTRSRTANEASTDLVRPSWRVGAQFGPCFGSGRSVEPCTELIIELQRYRVGQDVNRLGLRSQPARWAVRRAANEESGIGVGATLAASENDKWPPAPPPPPPDPPFGKQGVADDRNPDPLSYGGTRSLTVDFFLPVPVPPRFLVEPFAGVGFAQLEGGDATETAYGITDTDAPVVTYGLNLTTFVSKRLDVRVQWRSFTYFTEELTYLAPITNEEIPTPFQSLTSSSLTVGVGLRTR